MRCEREAARSGPASSPKSSNEPESGADAVGSSVRAGPETKASSSTGRAAVSKTAGWGFDSLLACQHADAGRNVMIRIAEPPGTSRNDRQPVMRGCGSNRSGNR